VKTALLLAMLVTPVSMLYAELVSELLYAFNLEL